ncbi:unnamed protein product [Pleuronectes platessa]|uniref:Uncharacterized protein n=1 Tax=Pleuronectes platessa TaxID=8262 RepID=A0A9N7VNK7_PLEPL|nr:unnamed protein product [Pleuronectes platessa]
MQPAVIVTGRSDASCFLRLCLQGGIRITLKFTDPDQTRFALSAASQLGPFKQRRLGESPGEQGGLRGTVPPGPKKKKQPCTRGSEQACSPALLKLVSRITSDPHQWRTTQVDPPPTHGIAIPAAERGGTPHRRRKRRTEKAGDHSPARTAAFATLKCLSGNLVVACVGAGGCTIGRALTKLVIEGTPVPTPAHPHPVPHRDSLSVPHHGGVPQTRTDAFHVRRFLSPAGGNPPDAAPASAPLLAAAPEPQRCRRGREVINNPGRGAETAGRCTV